MRCMKETSMGSIILDLQGLTLTPEESEILLHPHVGGVIFFSRNYETPDQLADLSAQIKRIRPQLLLCVDQEGGRVQRFQRDLTRLPPLGVLGKLVNKGQDLNEIANLSENLGQLMALEVRSLGVDLSFAPVLDLGTGVSQVIGDRAFHDSPDIISRLATSYVKGMSKIGMQAVGKHFPGHGSVMLDSHIALPQDPRLMEEITEDLKPFRKLIAEGIAGIMPAHIVYPKIDKDPVGFSSYWLQSVLRQQLGFEGTIISDDLSMGGASGMGNFVTRAQKAIQAGCDFLLVCQNRKEAIAILEGLEDPFDPLKQQRRSNLIAKGAAPSFSELVKNRPWQESVAHLERLAEEINYL